ncbi:restriction endonuclease subunit S [Hoeflea sp.]|uniref:restriction endonuclease subunit S n=1 Tax=Hoeflea sp. TaxID=1940281 RepID=UPI003A8F27F1
MCNELEILEGWDERILYDLAEYHNGAAFKPKDWVEDGLPIVRIEQINKPNSETDKFNGFVLPRNLIDTGDLIFSWSATLKVIIWSGGPAVLNQHLYKVVPNSGVNKQLLLQILDFNMEKLAGQSQGSTMKHVTRKELTKFRVKFPLNENEQEKIAIILRTVDEAIEKTEALIEKYGLIKAGMMHDLFTRGLTPDGKLRPPRDQAPELYKETPIGWIPKEWEYGKFGENVAVIDPNPSHRYPDEVSEGYPICSTENFSGEDGFDFKKSKLVPEKTFQQQNNRCQYKELDVIFARKGRIGFARRYGSDKKAFSHTVVIMKPISPDIEASWLLWLSRSDWLLKAIDRKMNTNSGVPTLGVDFIKNIEVPIPSPDEQRAIDTSLEAASRRIQIETDRKQKLALQKSGLMRDLLTGEVPVKVNDPEAAHV